MRKSPLTDVLRNMWYITRHVVYAIWNSWDKDLLFINLHAIVVIELNTVGGLFCVCILIFEGLFEYCYPAANKRHSLSAET